MLISKLIILIILFLNTGNTFTNLSQEEKVFVFIDDTAKYGEIPKIDISSPVIDEASKTGIISVKLNLTGFWMTSKNLAGRNFVELNIPGGVLMTEIGNPALPTLSTEVVLPSNTELRDIECQDELIKEYGKILLIPTQEPMPLEEKFIMDPLIYQKSELYPGKFFEITTDSFMGDRHIIVLKLFPLQYIPIDQTIRVYSLVLNITFSQKKIN